MTAVAASAEQNSANARPSKRQKKDGSETTLSLTSGRLKRHEKTQAAIQGLKEGTLSEAGFWHEINSKDKAALWMKYEGARNKVPEAKEAWQQMDGPGVLEKKKQLLLHFLSTGSAEEGGLKKSQEVANSKKEKEWFEWVPWKQIQDWYGPDEALERVEAGLIAVKRIGKKIFGFLLVKTRTELTVGQKKRIAAEQELALKGAELRACQKALAAARTDKEWEDLWSERRPDKSLQLKDALSKSSSSSDEEEESSQEEGKA